MTTRTDPERHKEQVRAANRARHRATKALIAKHRAEWDALYAKEADKEGVEPKPRDTPQVAKLKGQVAVLTDRLNAMKSGSRTRAAT